MSVHVGEIHTDISTAAAAAVPQHEGGAGKPGDTEDERWQQSRGRVRWLARRTSTDGFDD